MTNAPPPRTPYCIPVPWKGLQPECAKGLDYSPSAELVSALGDSKDTTQGANSSSRAQQPSCTLCCQCSPQLSMWVQGKSPLWTDCRGHKDRGDPGGVQGTWSLQNSECLPSSGLSRSSVCWGNQGGHLTWRPARKNPYQGTGTV